MICQHYKISHLPGGEVEYLESAAGCSYRLGDEALLAVHSRVVWCGACERFTNGELLESLDEIERKLELMRRPEGRAELGPVFARADAEVVAEMVRVWERRLEWRRRRTSAAKCLGCGSVDIVPIPWDRETPNPRGEGTVVVRASMGGVSVREETLYTAEGDRILG